MTQQPNNAEPLTEWSNDLCRRQVHLLARRGRLGFLATDEERAREAQEIEAAEREVEADRLRYVEARRTALATVAPTQREA